ncbi:phosphatidylinositol N-acetylglucosaminyltransferase subunit H-like isoform X2 [Diadema setosum]|uniref:phosphatidylinositol N-acetylglucosaminyltransferase subunit H-like isoform X2 n=1 Tax=Diadema setosum TaxID=31175 RepID=UPI003B3B2F21
MCGIFVDESLLLITSLGLQISSECYTGRQATKFIPLEAVHDVIIHEAVTMHKVVYYVAVLLRKTRDSRRPDSIVPVFLHTMPRLETLREILSAVHKTIHFDGPNREAARGNQDLYDR